MSLADDIKLLAEHPRARGCFTCRWLSEQSQEDQDQFSRYLAEGGAQSSLLRLCNKHGLGISETAFRRHVSNCMGVGE